MYVSHLGRLVVILATVAGFSAFAGSADAQITGSTGGNVVGHDPLPAPGNLGVECRVLQPCPAFSPRAGSGADAPLPGLVHGSSVDNVTVSDLP
jgi:hypothetical protein